VAELDFCREHGGASTNGPGDNGFFDRAVLDGLDDTVLFDSTNFTEKDEDLDVGVGLVAKKMVDKGRSGVSVTADGNTLVCTVGRCKYTKSGTSPEDVAKRGKDRPFDRMLLSSLDMPPDLET
jgi:hypothetical protein